MKKNTDRWSGCLISFAFLIISCAGTEITQKQVDDTYKGQPVSNWKRIYTMQKRES